MIIYAITTLLTDEIENLGHALTDNFRVLASISHDPDTARDARDQIMREAFRDNPIRTLLRFNLERIDAPL